MKKLANIIYWVKLILFVLNFYFIFQMLHNILDTGIFGIIFMVLYLVFVIKILFEILSQKKKYKNDIIYNFMQLGFIFYLYIISIKTCLANVYVTNYTFSYFRINYIILSVLIIFILVYSLLENKSSNN